MVKYPPVPLQSYTLGSRLKLDLRLGLGLGSGLALGSTLMIGLWLEWHLGLGCCSICQYHGGVWEEIFPLLLLLLLLLLHGSVSLSLCIAQFPIN